MKLFRSVRRNFKKLGISPHQHRLNGKTLMVSSCYWISNTINSVYIVREVVNFRELVNAVFITTSSISFATSFTILIILKNKVFHIADSTEKIADRGKIKSLNFNFPINLVIKINYKKIQY